MIVYFFQNGSLPFNKFDFMVSNLFVGKFPVLLCISLFIPLIYLSLLFPYFSRMKNCFLYGSDWFLLLELNCFSASVNTSTVRVEEPAGSGYDYQEKPDPDPYKQTWYGSDPRKATWVRFLSL